MFETRRLRLLHELRVRGTISAVAEALSFSASTVSQQLSLLEREAGVTLLEPDGRRLRLTSHGEVLADHAARVIDLEEQVRGALVGAGEVAATVRVAIFQSAAHAILPLALSVLGAEHPLLRVEVTEVPPEEGLFELAGRGYDLAVAEEYPGYNRPRRTGLIREMIGRDAIALAAPDDWHGEALADFRNRPWVMEPRGTAARGWAVQQCRAAGFEPDVRYEAANLTAHIALIRAGHAVGMLPDLVWSEPLRGVRRVELAGLPQREIFAASRATSSDWVSIRTVRDALQAAFARASLD